MPAPYPVTPDGRYIVVEGRLWRCANPALPPDKLERLTKELMAARRAISNIRKGACGDLEAACQAVDQAKVSLGERGPVWWDDGAPDYNRRLVRTTPYRDWFVGRVRLICPR